MSARSSLLQHELNQASLTLDLSSMREPVATEQADKLLLPFLTSASQAEAEHLLTELVSTHAEPIIRSIIKRKLHVSLSSDDGRPQNQDALEIRSEVYTHLLTELKHLREQPQQKSILNFRSYLAVITFNACHKYLRQKYPQRHSLKNRLRYLLTHQSQYALWEQEPNEWLCGLNIWQSQRREINQGVALQPLYQVAQTNQSWLPIGVDARRMSLTELVPLVFAELNAPVELDELVSLIAELQEIKDKPAQAEDDAAESNYEHEQMPDTRRHVADEVEQQLYLKRLWEEIVQLPVRQRAALLLNLRDGQGRDVMFLLPLTGVASIRQIAAALEMPAAELAALWNDLPLDDASIAARLSLTRQQVINLRKSARERLARRMKGL